MTTQHNVFIRKYGHMAIVITVLDWENFKELEKHSMYESPDLLLSGITNRTIYSNMNPSMLISTRGEVKDITEETKGIGIDGILTGNSSAGPIFGSREINGFSAITDMITYKL